jgi:hypothetical protein
MPRWMLRIGDPRSGGGADQSQRLRQRVKLQIDYGFSVLLSPLRDHDDPTG